MSGLGEVTRGITKQYGVQAIGFEGTNKQSRWMGRTDGSAPLVGDFEVGDWVTDASASAAIWVCITAGSPGSWVRVGGGGSVLHVGPSAPTGGEVFWFDTDEVCS